MDEPRCGGLTAQARPCKNWAGFKTDHVGEGRCHLHGGKSTGPTDPSKMDGNKNAVKTGEYETLHYSALTDEEKGLHDSLDTSPRSQAVSGIKLSSIREHRILIRIKRARELEETSETGLMTAALTKEDGWDKGKKTNEKVEYLPIADHVMRLDDALGRVQAVKAKYIDQLRGVLKENPTDSGGLDAMVAALDRAGKAAAERKEAELQTQRELDAASAGVLGE